MSFEPKIVGFLCNWCSYTGADLAGTSRIQYPPNIRIIRVMCSARIDPTFVLQALGEGADGVLICGCHPGDCHYSEGNYKAHAALSRCSRRCSTPTASSTSGCGWSGSAPARASASPTSSPT